MSVKLYVGNLSQDTTGDELRALFSQVGEVESCHLIMGGETGNSRGFGFIEMNSKDAADAAKEKLNGQDLHGRALKIDDAKPRSEYKNATGYSVSRRS